MKTFFQYSLVLWFILLLALPKFQAMASGHDIIPFDTLTQKYTYKKELILKDVSNRELYKKSKSWSEEYFKENKYYKEEKSGTLKSKGTFNFSASIKKGDIKIPFIYTVTYTVTSVFMDGRCTFILTDILLSTKDAKGKTIVQPLEAFEKKMKNFGNQKESSERFVKDSFMEIHKNLAPILPATEIAIVK